MFPASYEITGDSSTIVLVGHEHDHTSYYLRALPQWKKQLIPNMISCRMPHNSISILHMDVGYKPHLHPKTVEFLEAFKQTPKFKATQGLFRCRESWLRMLGPVHLFLSSFIQLMQLLLSQDTYFVCAEVKPIGGGQIALPGGFLNEHEVIRHGAIRELKEETAIAITKEELDKFIIDEHDFDHPDRSESGRTIRTAFFLDLGNGPLPKVKGSQMMQIKLGGCR